MPVRYVVVWLLFLATTVNYADRAPLSIAGSALAKDLELDPVWAHVRQLLGSRMLLGVYLAQYCITTITYFFLTWFPVYLVEGRRMSILQVGFVASLPALGWAVVSDTSPRQIAGLSGALFNTFGNTAAITTPIVIGYLVKGSGQFASALVFVGANAIVATGSHLFVEGEIKRLELKNV